MELNSRKLLKMLEMDGWRVVRINGDHHIMKHPGRAGTVVVQHPRRDMAIGTVRKIYKDAGWRP